MENNDKNRGEITPLIPITKWRIDYSLCNGCKECIYACDRGLLKLVNRKIVLIDEIACPQCGDCTRACGPRAITLT